MGKLLTAGYMCAFASLGFFPLPLALAGVVIGIMVLSRERLGHGIALIVLSVLCGYIGMSWSTAVWNRVLLPQTTTSTDSAELPWHVVSIESRITSADDVQTKYAWKLTIRNDSRQPAVFSGPIEFQDADGFIVDQDIALDLKVRGTSSGVFTGYALMRTEDARKVTRVTLVQIRF